MGFYGCGEISKDRTPLQSARLAYRQHPLDEATTRLALCPKREFTIDHRRPKSALRRVVGRFDAWNVHERPEPFSVVVKFVAHADQAHMAAVGAEQQQAIYFVADGRHFGLKGPPRDLSVFVTPPNVEH